MLDISPPRSSLDFFNSSPSVSSLGASAVFSCPYLSLWSEDINCSASSIDAAKYFLISASWIAAMHRGHDLQEDANVQEDHDPREVIHGAVATVWAGCAADQRLIIQTSYTGEPDALSNLPFAAEKTLWFQIPRTRPKFSDETPYSGTRSGNACLSSTSPHFCRSWPASLPFEVVAMTPNTCSAQPNTPVRVCSPLYKL